MFNGLHTVAQGTVGTAIAIAELAKVGFTVCVPLVDAQAFDLIAADSDGRLFKVQVKTTGYKIRNRYVVQLKRVHHNKTENIIRRFDPTKVDIVVVVCSDESVYMIPSGEINSGNSITLGEKYEDWRVQRGIVGERFIPAILKIAER